MNNYTEVCSCCKTLILVIIVSLFTKTTFAGNEPLNRFSDHFFTLHKALKSGIENNLEIKTRSIEHEISIDEAEKVSSRFDPSLTLEFNSASVDKLQNSIDFASTSGIRNWKEDNWNLFLGVQGKTSNGTSYGVDYNVNTMDNSLNRQAPSLNALFNPEVETFLGVNFSHPLLKNSGRAVNLAPDRIARLNIDIRDSAKVIQVNNSALEIANNYYDLAFADENIKVKQQGLALAERFLEISRRRLQVGTGDGIDVYQGEIQVSEARERVLLAENYFRQKKTDLLRLILGKVSPEMNFPEMTFPEIKCPGVNNFDISALYRVALENRADYRAALLELTLAGVRKNFARRQVLPELNVSFSYGFTGLRNSASSSFNQLNDWENPKWSAGITYAMPLGGFDSETADLRIMDKRVKLKDIDIERILSNIILDIRNSVGRIENLTRRLELSRQSRILSEKALEVEENRYKSGRASSYTVLELQNKVFNSRTRELSALIDLAKAWNELWASQGIMLEKHGFTVGLKSSDDKMADSRKSAITDSPSHQVAFPKAESSREVVEKLRNKLATAR